MLHDEVLKYNYWFHICTIIFFMYYTYILSTDDVLLWHVSTCIGHLQVTVKRNEVFACLLYLHVSCWWCGVCTGLCCLFSCCFPGFAFCLALWQYWVKNRTFGDGVVIFSFKWWFCLVRLLRLLSALGGLQTRYEHSDKVKHPCPSPKSNLGHLASSPVTILSGLHLHRLLAPYCVPSNRIPKSDGNAK